MSFTSDSKQQISLKKLVGKAHTKNEAEFFNEAKSTGLTVSSQTIFGEAIPAIPSSTNLFDITDDIVEYLRLPLVSLPESLQDGRYHGFSSKLPSNYETDSLNSKSGEEDFVNDKDIFTTKGNVQLVPPSFGDAYEVKLYYGGDANTKGSGTRIPVLDNRNWYFDYFNGVLFQQTPPGTGDHAENPDFIEVFVYIGKKSIEVNNSSLSSLWELDPSDNNNLRATSILDGDTGLFSLDFNMTLDSDNIVNTIKYTTTNRQDARDLYFEFDDNGNITTKE